MDKLTDVVVAVVTKDVVGVTYSGHGDHHEVHTVPVGQPLDPVYTVRVGKVGRVPAVL